MGTYSDLLKPKQENPEPNKDDADAPQDISETPSKNTVEPHNTERFSERKSERFEPESFSFPSKRRTKRHSFEFYDDQILAIKRLVYEATISGENISQSDIVRAALDEYLNNNK